MSASSPSLFRGGGRNGVLRSRMDCGVPSLLKETRERRRHHRGGNRPGMIGCGMSVLNLSNPGEFRQTRNHGNRLRKRDFDRNRDRGFRKRSGREPEFADPSQVDRNPAGKIRERETLSQGSYRSFGQGFRGGRKALLGHRAGGILGYRLDAHGTQRRSLVFEKRRLRLREEND